MFKFWLFVRIATYLLLIFLSVNLDLASCTNLSPSIDTRYWRTNSSDKIVPAENLIGNLKYASTVEVLEVSTDKTTTVAETVQASRNIISTTALAPNDSTETSSVQPEYFVRNVTIVPPPNATSSYPTRQKSSTIIWPLIFVLAILLFLLVLIGWIICQFLQKEQDGREGSTQVARDSKVNTISSAGPSTTSGTTATEELPTTRSELLVKSPLKKARAGDSESQKTASRVNLSRTVSETVRSPMSSTKPMSDKESALQSVATSPTSNRSALEKSSSSRASSSSPSQSRVSSQASAHSKASSPDQGVATASEAYKFDSHR